MNEETQIIALPIYVIEFMRDLAREMKEQDCRCTASPYYYIVQASRQVVAPADYGNGEASHYYHADWGEGHTREEWEPIIAQHNEENDDSIDLDTFIDNCDEFGMHDIDVEENVFLTFRSYEQHMKMNGHNYRHLKNVQSYVKHCFRNPEMEKLFEAIMAFAEPNAHEPEASGGEK